MGTDLPLTRVDVGEWSISSRHYKLCVMVLFLKIRNRGGGEKEKNFSSSLLTIITLC